MKKLTRMLLINWHFFRNTLIDFDTINFLTGKNSAGKSTIIDAFQVVLLGETRSNAFNRAASKKSERTLKSYLIGSMGEDRDSGLKSLREGKDFSTFIVTEFYDDMKAEYFCLGAIFDSYSDGGDVIKRFFWLKDKIPSCRFIENGKTMNTKRTSEFFKKNYTNRFETRDTVEAYRQIILEKLNIHDRKFQFMLKKAISFEPINDIEKFITENICDIEDDIDITSMQDNILYYKQQEEDVERFKSKLERLKNICNLFNKIEKFRARHIKQQFLIDYGKYNYQKEKLNQENKKVEKCNADIEESNNEYYKFNDKIAQAEKECDELKDEKNRYWSDCNGNMLEAEKKRYSEKISLYKENIQNFIHEFRTSVIRWKSKLNAVEDAENVKRILDKAENLSEKDFDTLSLDFFSKLRDEFITLRTTIEPQYRDIENKIRSCKAELEDLERQIGILKKGTKPYPYKAEKLKTAISYGLKKKYGKDIPVSFLADLLEIKDPLWHKAVEGYLNTQRMNIIVPPEYFMDAYEIYKYARLNTNIHEYAVLDLEKVYQAAKIPLAGSLAGIVRSNDKYVQAYVNYLLGRVMMCYDEKKLRDYPTSVTSDCMLYHGFAVRSLNSDAYEEPYIGMNSIEKQIKYKIKRKTDKQVVIDELISKAEKLKPAVTDEWFLTESYLSMTVSSALANHSQKIEAEKRLTEIIEKWEKIDMTKLWDFDQKIKIKKDEIDKLRKQKEETVKMIREYELERDEAVKKAIPVLELDIKESEKHISENYTEEFVQNIGVPRYLDELAVCGSASAIAEKFDSPVKQTASRIIDLERQLTELRSSYNTSEQTSYNIKDVLDNSEFEKAYDQINNYELPKYQERIKQARNDAMEQFKSDFLYKLRSNIQSAYERIDDLNRALKKARFGGETYRFEVSANPDYREYYDMIMSPELENGNIGLFSIEFMNKYHSVIENLFAQIVQDDEGKTAQSVEIFSKYKTYLTFDLLSRDDSGRTYKLSKNIFTKSGGETQTPFYLAVLASFAELYKVRSNNEFGNTARIVIFDEAFNKMDGERIIESVKLLRSFGLQAIICSPPEKVADIVPISDKTLLVYKEPIDKGYNSTVIEWSKEMETEL